MNTLRNYYTSSRSAFGLAILCSLSYGLVSVTTASAATWEDVILPEYYVYTKGSTVIANKAKLKAAPPVWVLDTFTPKIVTNGAGCDSRNDAETHNFDSNITFHNCAGLSIQESTASAANNQWFQDVNMSYIVGDFDNSETIDIGRGFIVRHGRSALGDPDFKQNATAERSAKDTTGSNQYDCDNPNPNRTRNCSLLIYFKNGDPGDFHIFLSNEYGRDGDPSSGHEYWYDGPETRDYHTLTFHPNGGSVVENNADPQVLVKHTAGTNVLREYDETHTAANFPLPTRDGYEFLGWATTATGNCKASGTCRITRSMGSDKDLYAHWTPIVVNPLSYELTPLVDVDAPTVRAGSDMTYRPNVIDSTSNPTNDTVWSVRRIIIPPGTAVPYTGVRTSGSFDCLYYTSKGMNCTDVESGNRVFTSVGPTYLATASGYTYHIADGMPFGTKICYALSLNSRNENANQPAEALTCVVVAKAPMLQVWGNDVRIGSALLTADNTSSSRIKTNGGSWGEYGVLAPSTISTFGSASQQPGSKLTFANNVPGALGNYLSGGAQASSLGAIPDIGRYLEEAGNATNRTRTGINLIVGQATVGAYQANTVIDTNGTVTITGDIINNSAGSTLTQMVIIANDININPNVRQVDAWLIAPTGNINTCAMAGDQRLTIDICNEQLRINGPITARSLQLRRTYSGVGDVDPAEIINLRGDAYIWIRGITDRMGTIRTTYLRELPPRY